MGILHGRTLGRKDRTARPGRRWWQRVFRAVVVSLLAAAGAYVTLPWWAPTGLIRDWVVAEMSRQMGASVRMGSLSLSWSDGIEVRDLVIESPAPFDKGPMVLVERLRMDFSPVDMFLRKKVAWMELERPWLHGQFDANGNANFTVLSKLQFEAEPDRISARQAMVTLKLPQDDRRIGFKVSDAQFVRGQVQWLGRVTASADLQQTGERAPVGLHAAAGSGEDDVAVAATFNFANIDLEQLWLPRLLNLPLKKLSGRCGGSLKLRVNREGIVDHFDTKLVIRRLDAQPRDGPQLPVIDEAGLNIQATWDPLSERIEIHQGSSVRLPGVELAGCGVISAGEGFHAVLLLDANGVVYPDRLAALFPELARLPEGLEFDGPLKIESLHFALDPNSRGGAGPRVHLSLSADGSEGTVRQGRRILKPADRKLTLQLAAVLDQGAWTLDVNKGSRLCLGDNTFAATGRISDFRRLRDRWAEPGHARSLREVLEDLCQLECKGAWELRELDSLRDLHPDLAEALKDVRLRGALGGSWSVSRTTRTRVDAVLNLPARTALSVTDRFVKPENEPMGIVAAGTIDPASPGFKELSLDVMAGAARFSVGNGHVHFEPQSAGLAIEAHGEFDANSVEALAQWFPALSPLKGKARGSLRGEFSWKHDRGVQRGDLTTDLKDLEIAWEDALWKPLGQEGALEAGLVCDPGAPGDRRCQVGLRWRCKEAELSADVLLPGLFGPEGLSRGRLDANANVADARWLTVSCPALGSRLKDADLSGPVTISASGTWQGRRWDGEVAWDAGDLEYVTDRPVRFAKRPGVPLAGRFRGWVEDRGPDGLAVELRSGSLQLAKCRAEVSGRAVLDRLDTAQAGAPRRAPRLREFQGKLDAAISLDESLARALSDLGDLARDHGLVGEVRASGEAIFDGNCVRLKSHLDAGDLAVANFIPPSLRDANGQYALGKRRIGPFLKPKGVPAEVDVEMEAAKDLSRFAVGNLRVRAGGVSLLAGGVVVAKLNERGLPVEPVVQSGHVAVSCPKVEEIAPLCPQVAQYRPAGGLFADLEWKGEDGGRIPYVTFHAEQLAGRYRGKEVLLDGEMTLQDVRPQKAVVDANGVKQQTVEFLIDGIRTGGLEFRAGRNHGWLVAQVGGLQEDPNGSFHLLAEYLDTGDLADWLADPNEPARSAGAPAEKDDRRIQDEAGSFIGRLRDWLSGANLAGRVSIGHIRAFDSSVGECYDIQCLEANAIVSRGAIRLHCDASVYGGIYRRDLQLNLADAKPSLISLTEIQDVAGTRNVQPQLARYFPGNTVSGSFSRSEKVAMPLRDVVANFIDSRWPVRAIGSATTVAIDGVVEGRAAPKFVTTFFPGLNLTKFKYNKMTGFAKYAADGSAENEMIFSGQAYDMYMEGRTGADGTGQYEIGLVLLGTMVSPQVHVDLKQGRIPILKFRGRIEGGKIRDESVSYLWPHETAFVIFLKNNPVYRIWVAAQKR